jgi:monoamine oxidase
MSTDEDHTQISRRRFVTGTLVAGASAAGLGAESADARTKPSHKHASKHKPKPKRPGSAVHSADVVVIGAGLSGLTAARAVKAAGHSVIVVEARGRVGGRCFSRPLGVPGATDVANMGATFVGPTQHQILGLLAELKIGTFDVYSQGKLLYYENGKLSPYTGTIPPSSDPTALVQLGVALSQIDQMSATVPLDKPWTAPNAAAWDSMTAQTWAEQNLPTPAAQKLFALAVEAILSVEPGDVSFLYFLFYIHSAGNTEVLIDNAGTGGAQDFRVSGGTQGISIAIANQLGRRNVLLNTPVRSLTQGPKSIVAHSDKTSVKAKRAIVAIPAHLAGRIFYEPRMSAVRDQLTQRVPIGSLIKTIAVYDTPFWRAQGLNGQVTSDQGPVKVMFDASPASGTPGVLLGFIDGDDARALDDKSDQQRASAALASYARYFGTQAGAPRVYFDQVWANEVYTGGCPVGVMAPGVMTEYAYALREPSGRIHWAGTETATVWNGYMDGAVQAGKRAAAEVLAEL